MKSLLRNYLINFGALFATTRLLPGLTYEGGIKTLLMASLVFMVINWLIVPLLRIMFLPLNLLTLGIFGWAINVVALYFLTVILPQLRLIPYDFPGLNLSWVIIPPASLNLLTVAVVASFLIGLISHFLTWLVHN